MANEIAYDWDIDLALSADRIDPAFEVEETPWAFRVEPEDDEDEEPVGDDQDKDL